MREPQLESDPLLSVCIHHEDKELLLYHIEPAERCDRSFTVLLERLPSRILFHAGHSIHRTATTTSFLRAINCQGGS